MALTEAQRTAARDRKRLQRKREKERLYRDAAATGDDDPADEGSSQIAPAGLVEPPASQPVSDLMTEQALWVQKRRMITELELARRRGELVSIEDAARQSAALARRIRAALDRAPSLLPAELSPENHAACKSAMAAAIKAALAGVTP
jgi:hypothetical protein